MELDVVDRYDYTTSAPAFAQWLYAWKARWLAGARIRVLAALDGTHAIVVADPDAPTPSSLPVDVQLELDVERN